MVSKEHRGPTTSFLESFDDFNWSTDIKSINAYFGLILINVFFGENFLVSTGLNQLVNKLSDEFISSGGQIITNANCIHLENKEGNFHVRFENDKMKSNEMIFHKIISAVTPTDLLRLNNLDPLTKIDGQPMTLEVITSPDTLWDMTWGLIICDDNSPIYALCDWRNISKASKETPILAICEPSVTKEEVVAELKRLFPLKKTDYKIIFEKKWTIGLHQPNENLFKIQRDIASILPKNFYLAGDWMVLPALEGAVISGARAAKILIKNL